MHISEALLILGIESNRVFKKELTEKDGIFTKYLTTMTGDRTGKTLRCIKMIDKDKVVSFNSPIPFNDEDEWLPTNEIDFIFEDGRVY